MSSFSQASRGLPWSASGVADDSAQRDEMDAVECAQANRLETSGVSAYQRALGFLVRREHSRTELQSKLAARGHDAGEIAEALDRLGEQNYQSDQRYAESMARARLSGGYGPQRLRAELRQRGIGNENIETALSEALEAAPGDWVDQAEQALRRRFGESSSDDPRDQRRQLEFLLRRGFDIETARQALRRLNLKE